MRWQIWQKSGPQEGHANLRQAFASTGMLKPTAESP
jgi:hypothetical protein